MRHVVMVMTIRGLGAEVRPVPAVPYKDEMNYNHQAKVRTVFTYERRRASSIASLSRFGRNKKA